MPHESTALLPAAFDVVLADISKADLALITREFFGFENLSAATPADAGFPARGVVVGVNRRVFVPLAVRHESSAVRVLFVVDTGSPYTFLCEDTLRTLGFVGELPSSLNLFLNDMKICVGVSHRHFASVNLLGTDFLFFAKASVAVNFAALECVIDVTKR